ncbi:hypothetical protein B0A52_00226 [Exophiala mesophila]|uniref:Uncharacterized protein n=1 Tax=Exophiala mesophila TaxID=212818 RepID=A0A438NJG7_EXOME|nr:hypothetical protein B0A52_00226 [Exophiala mesophila]
MLVQYIGTNLSQGYMTFQPAFEELEMEKRKKREQLEAADLGPNLIEITQSSSQSTPPLKKEA